jgi:hypothetical protein
VGDLLAQSADREQEAAAVAASAQEHVMKLETHLQQLQEANGQLHQQLGRWSVWVA